MATSKAKKAPTRSVVTPSSTGDRELGQFEERDVVEAGMTIPSVAGGLREAMDMDPFVIHSDEEVVVVFHLRCVDVNHKRVKDGDDWRRVHVMDVLNAVFVDGDLAAKQLTTQAERKAKRDAEIAEQKERDKGNFPLPNLGVVPDPDDPKGKTEK